MRIFEEMRKNVLSLLRSPAALVTLIIGPLTLLLLVGFTLSGDEPQGIRIGVTGSESVKLNATVENYATLDDCLAALRGQQIHLCLEFQKFETERGVSQGTVVFHVDESREQISSLVLQQVSKQLGVESSRIRVEAVQGLLNEFGRIAAFMADKRSDLVQLRTDALTLRADVRERRERLEQEQTIYRASFYPVRDALANTSVSLSDVQDELTNIVALSSNTVDAIANASNETNTSALRSQVDGLSALVNTSRDDADQAHNSSVALLQSLDDIDVQLDAEINTTKEYEQKIDEGVLKIDALLVQLDKDIEELSKLDPSIAQRIDKPILQEVKTLFKKLLPIQASFAQLFAIVVMFISTLFGTIVTLMEINSRAVLRNTLTPTGEGWTLVGLALTSMIVVAIQAAVLVLVAQYMLDVNVLPALREFVIVGGLLALTFIFVGMAVALALRKEQASILVATFAALVVLLFSDVMTSIELMPELVGTLVRKSPLVVATMLLKQSQLFAQKLTIDGLTPVLIALGLATMLLFSAYNKYKARAARW